MKMPEKINSELFAPCGINCITCEDYLKENNSCPGCLISNRGKKKSALKCKIKECYDKKKFKYCGRCSEFPCKLIKKHDKNSIKRYDISTFESAKRIQYMGIGKIIESDQQNWTCPECGGIITYEMKKCSECGYKKN
ncbi:DUF3795 domain-containing protein [Methanobrevibacter sp.]